MALTEEEVYNGTKRWLRKNGYILLAGQPPRGVDHLPVIEIKQPTGEKGSRDSYKPDLVAFKDGIFYIIECKPGYDTGDLQKVTGILNSEARLFHFYRELQQYQLLHQVNYTAPYGEFRNCVAGILAFSGHYSTSCPLQQLIVTDWKGQARLIKEHI